MLTLVRQAIRSPLVRTWAGAILISFSGVFIRFADVEATRSAFYRNLYAVPAFVFLVWWTRRGGKSSNQRLIIPAAILVGFLEGAEVLAYHSAVGIVGAGLATVLPNLQILMVGIIGIVVFQERPRKAFWFAVPLVLVGVWLLSFTGEPIVGSQSMVVGVGIGVVGAVLYSGFLVALRLVRIRHPDASTFDIMASITIGIVLITGIAAAYQGVAAPAQSLSANAWLVALAIGTPVAGWLLLASSIHRLPVAMTSVALLLQPALAMVWGVVLLGEVIGQPQLIGVAAILLGVAIAHRATSEPVPNPGD